MIVMKFGGTSVESAAAIREGRVYRPGAARAEARRCRLRDGQDHEQAARHRGRGACRGIATKRSTCFDELARVPSDAKAASSSRNAAGPISKASSTALFQELEELVKGRRRHGRTDAAGHRRHLQLRRAAFERDRRARASKIWAFPPRTSIRAM